MTERAVAFSLSLANLKTSGILDVASDTRSFSLTHALCDIVEHSTWSILPRKTRMVKKGGAGTL